MMCSFVYACRGLFLYLYRLVAVRHAVQVNLVRLTDADREAAMQMGWQTAAPMEVCSRHCQSRAQRADPAQSLSSAAQRPCSLLRREGVLRTSMPTRTTRHACQRPSQGRDVLRTLALSRAARCLGTQCPTARPCCKPCSRDRPPQQVLQECFRQRQWVPKSALQPGARA